MQRVRIAKKLVKMAQKLLGPLAQFSWNPQEEQYEHESGYVAVVFVSSGTDAGTQISSFQKGSITIIWLGEEDWVSKYIQKLKKELKKDFPQASIYLEEE